MGEIADMMLDGTMCAGCGVWMDDGNDGPGFPQYCYNCRREERENTPQQQPERPHPLMAKVNCPTCHRRVKEIGLKDHLRDVHGVGKKSGDGA